MSQNDRKKQSQVKRSDVKAIPRRNWEKNYLIFSLGMLFVSLGILLYARHVATERVRIPYAGVLLNKPVSSGSTTLTVKKVFFRPGTKQFSAPQGYEFLIVTLAVRNNGEKPLNVFPTTDTYVKTSDGKVSYVAPYRLVQPFHSGSVLPGEATEGELSYVVPKDSIYKFYVEASWSGGAIPFMIQSNENHKQNGS